MAGYRDVIDNNAKNLRKHSEYKKADRAYNKDYGALEDYRDGYQQGFEKGYAAGFEKRSFDATIPAELNKRGVIVVETIVETTTSETTVKENVPVAPPVEVAYTNKVEEVPPAQTQEVPSNTVEQKVVENAPVEATNNTTESSQLPVITTVPVQVVSAPGGEGTIVIPVETELVVELIDDINTERSREGDNFKARVSSPNEINGAIIEGKVSKIQKPGRFKRRAEMLLSFNRIILSESRWSNFNAILTEVLPVKGDNVRRVDTEGTVEGKSSVKSDSVKVGATTGTGLFIGAIAGGPVGAAVGAGIGAAIGAGVVVVERGKHIKLNKSQQLRIKTAYETQIR